MDEEKFSTVGGSDKPEKKGFKVKVITLLAIVLIIIIGVLVAKTIIMNKIRQTDEKNVSEIVINELNRIKSGDKEALETYLQNSDVFNNSDEFEEIEEELEDEEIEDVEKSEKIIQDEEETENDENELDEVDDTDEIEDIIDDEEYDEEYDEENYDEEDDKMFTAFLSTLEYEITDINVEKNNATVTAKITNKDSGEIFRNYFTRAIKLAINQALSSNKSDAGESEKELQAYLEEQAVSSEIPVVTNEVKFNLEKENNEWKITDYDKDMVDVVFPNLINVVTELGEQYGEYGD